MDMKLEYMEPCPVTKEEFVVGRALCKKCMMFEVCSTAASPNATEIISKAMKGLGLE